MLDDPQVAIIVQRPTSVEVPWVRFLLGRAAGEVIKDEARTIVRPHSVILCDDLDRLTPDFLNEVRRVGTVGLFHIAQEWYQDPLDAYRSFAFVWRNHYHSALAGTAVRQLPLPPAAMQEITLEPAPEARKPITERRYSWSFAGEMKTTRVAMLKALKGVAGGHPHITWEKNAPAHAELGPGSYLEMLADSKFVPCSMGNAHLESFRVYETLEMGAIPIVERRPWLDYYGDLLGGHPMPTVRSWSEAPGLITPLLADDRALRELQERLVDWWTGTKRALAAQVAQDVASLLADGPHAPALAETPLPSRWRGRMEMLRHHNLPAARQRAMLTARRLVQHRSFRRQED
ncbi:MAG TPA: hypothetical protein VGJ86_17145 [Acidimicrobiales bacterium]|jgi:hypothetical protein